MVAALSVEEYVARQPRYTWRRALMRSLIRTIGFTLLAHPTVTGQENIPDSGPTILMMNHLSLIDPVVCIGAVHHRFVIPMTKIENLHNPLFGLLVRAYAAYTVDREAVDRKALENSIALVKSGQMILIAPEGTRHPEGLAPAKDGLTYVAVKSNAVILPTALAGSQHYKTRWKALRRVPVQVNFGRPFRFKTEGRARIPRDELTLMTQEAMYQLALAQPDPALRGAYHDLSHATTHTLEFVDPHPD
ncbi:MAG: hypothetical protein OHK0046_01900 [Anaerolineae bacterium]